MIAQTPAQNRSLLRLATRAGFGFVGSVLGDKRVTIEAERGDIVFFLFHHKLSDDTMRAVIKLLRDNPDDAIRLAPLLLFVSDGPMETILKYVKFGFDDVISLPEKLENLVTRAQNQLNNPQIYFETETYLGPDRRRMEIDMGNESRRGGDFQHTKLTIQRTLQFGVRVIRREFLGNRAPQAAIPFRRRA